MMSTVAPAPTLGAQLVPTAWGGARESAAGLVRDLRPLFAENPSRAVARVAAPLLAGEALWRGGEDDRAEWFAQRLLLGGSLAFAPNTTMTVGSVTGVPTLSGDAALVLNAGAAECVVVVRSPSGERRIVASTGGQWRWGPPLRTTGLCDVAFASARAAAVPVAVELPTDRAADDAAAAIVAALTIGMLEQALRLAVPYAKSRGLYGATVWDIPHARSILAEANADLLAADALARAAVDAIDSAAPSAIVAAGAVLVPHLVTSALRGLSVLFGSTFYARVEPYEQFETLVRDTAALPLLGLPDATRSNLATALEHSRAELSTGAIGADVQLAVDRSATRYSGQRPAMEAAAIDVAVDDLSDRIDADQPITHPW